MFASDELYNERREICRQCEYRDEILNITERCKVCGCVIPIKAKIESEKCPEGKW
jgi:hypothetical protein